MKEDNIDSLIFADGNGLMAVEGREGPRSSSSGAPATYGLLAEGSARELAEWLGIPAIRLDILASLADRPMTVSELMHAHGHCRNALTDHLTTLQQVGAVAVTIQRVTWSNRPARIYSLDPAGAEALAWKVFDSLVGDS